jgi:hypothetical protein
MAEKQFNSHIFSIIYKNITSEIFYVVAVHDPWKLHSCQNHLPNKFNKLNKLNKLT